MNSDDISTESTRRAVFHCAGMHNRSRPATRVAHFGLSPAPNPTPLCESCYRALRETGDVLGFAVLAEFYTDADAPGRLAARVAEAARREQAARQTAFQL